MDADPEPVRRTLLIEEPSNRYLIHPVSALLVRLFARIGVTPNMVSLLGMACGVLAGFAYARYRWIGWDCAGLALMLGWHVMDGADGQLARLTHAQSDLGRVLDGICDYATFTAVYVALALVLSREHGGWVWLLVAAAGVSHAVQAGAYEAQREEFTAWGLGRAAPAMKDAGGITGRMHAAYAVMQRATTGVDQRSRARLAGLLAAQPGRRDGIRAAYRSVFAPNVHRWSVLCANYRTLAIFVFSVAGRPLWYFWWEIVALSLVMAVLLMGQRNCYARLFARLG